MTRPRGAIGNPRTIGAEKLRGPLKKVFAKLKAAGVPSGVMPTSNYIATELLPKWIDWDKVDAWAAGMAAAARPTKPLVVRLRKPRK
jgi:hypothetical protein